MTRHITIPQIDDDASRAVLEPCAEGWQHRLNVIVETMREISMLTDPQAMVDAYSRRMRTLLPIDGSISLSRRNLRQPYVRITRSTTWQEEVNPWKHPEWLPVLQGGLLSELVYADAPRIIDDLRIADDDPAAEYLADQRSLMALPLFDQGVALNMVVLARQEPNSFSYASFPEMVWMSNLFGRATHNLVLSEELRKAYEAVDFELKTVADIQRSLLPAKLPAIPTMDVAAYYQTSHRAGGDYYDFFELPDGRWGILIADVSGHGTPAAVLMAIMHSIAHTYPRTPEPPAEFLRHINRILATLYTASSGTFVTAFYGIYDPEARKLTYTSAGHNPPRLKRCADGSVASLDCARGLPLGIMQDAVYDASTYQFLRGDQIVFYTDGITEAFSPDGKLFGLQRLDQALENCRLDADNLIKAVLDAVESFAAGRPADDDRTMLVAKIS